MSDPRTENAKAVHIGADGKVDGVELVWQPLPSAQYALVRAELIDEAAAVGSTVANCVVLDKDGIQTGENVYLAWPWPALTDWGLPGNPNGQHMITNGYQPPVIGPLALYVGKSSAPLAPISDVIAGVGLPWNRHVCFRFVWKERTAVVEPPVEPPVGATFEDLLRAMAERHDVLPVAPDTALVKAAVALTSPTVLLWPTSDEFRFDFGEPIKHFVGRRFRNALNNDVYALWYEVGRYDVPAGKLVYRP